jgi:hypothetical protein
MCDFTPSTASEILPAIDKQALYEFVQVASREYQELQAQI